MDRIFYGLGSFAKVEAINKGWSGDSKFCVTAQDGTRYLLRVSDIARFEASKSVFSLMARVADLGVPICAPVEFGTCDEGVYTLYDWIDGVDLEQAMPSLTKDEQYALGIRSGEAARLIHTIPAPADQEAWASRFGRKTDTKMQKYKACGLRFEGDERVIAYIESHRHLLDDRHQCFQHGDYHVGNMMLENGGLVIIDFDRFDFGDPWEEFNRIVWSAASSPSFATGQIRGYFNGEPPVEFFQLLTFYIASNALSSIYWAIPFGETEVKTMMKQAGDVLGWFNNMEDPVPAWYLKSI